MTKHRTTRLTTMVALAGLLATGFSSVTISAGTTTAWAKTSVALPAGRPKPTTIKPTHQISLAMIANSNNDFLNEVHVGFNKAAAVLGALGVKTTWIVAGSDVTVSDISAAMDGAVADGYNGVAPLMPGDGICPFIKTAVSKHVAVAGWNGPTTCAQASGSAFFLGANLNVQGVEAGQLMCKGTKDLASAQHPGKVGIITQGFAFQALEERRLNFISGLKKYCPWVTPVSDGVQDTNADPTLMVSQTNAFIASTPNLVGIYVTGGNPYAAGVAVGAAGKQAKVKVVAFDFTPQNVAQMEKGNIYGLISQDPFGQGYDTMIDLYNYVVTGIKPPHFFIPVASVVATKANIVQAVAAQASGGI
jgi:ribose transport system substrate-binding protein